MDPHASSRASVPTRSLTERWEIDLGRSSLNFKLRHLVIRQIHGTFARWGGTALVNRVDPPRSSVRIWVDLASIVTGDPERDDHVRSSEFFDVGQFPRAELNSTEVRVEDDQVVIDGTLELRGVVGAIQLRASIGPPVTGADGRQRVRCTAHGTLDRQSFGLHWNQDLDIGGVVVGDEVEITSDVELVRSE